MPDIRDTVTAFVNALYAGDVSTARRYLADQFSFTGPAARFSDPDRYLSATLHAAQAVRHVQTHKVFVDGQDVCLFYDLHIDHAVGLVPVAEWYHFQGDKISAIRTILDTAPFTSSGAEAAETALDPVCGMTVDTSSASATRMHSAQTYYFCSPACADAFDSEPRRFLPKA